MATIAYNDVLSKIQNLLPTGSQITASDHRQVEQALLDFAESQWLVGDIKEIDCDQSYIDNNFIQSGPTKGLGINQREGWAICNGNNGTKNRGSRVSIAYDENRTLFETGLPNVIGATGGAERHTLDISQMPTHNHDFQVRQDSSSGGNYLTLANTSNSDEGTWGTEGDNARILNKGGNQPHNNMQPYIVTLFIQKIPTP